MSRGTYGVYVGVENYVYGLIQCSTNELVYVGQTTDLERRFRVHLSSTVKDLRNDCQMVVLEAGVDLGDEHEYFWIEYMRSLGCNLRNKHWRLRSQNRHFSTDRYNKFSRTLPHLTIHMNEAGISVEQMVQLSGLSFSTITVARNGGRLEPHVAFRICNVLRFGARILAPLTPLRRRNLVNGWVYMDRAVKRIEAELAAMNT